MEDLAYSDPGVVERAIKRFKHTGESDAQAWDRIAVEPLEDESWDELAQQVDGWCSPLKGLDQDIRFFHAREVHWLTRHAESHGDFAVLPPLPGERIFTLDLSGVDPRVALMIETRVGTLHPRDRKRLHAIELPVAEEDLAHLVRLAVTGEARSPGWDLHSRYLKATSVAITSEPPSALSGKEYLLDTPFARTQRWLVRVQTADARGLPVVCVVGDAAADHALAMLCDRLFHHAAWVPLSLLNEDGPLGSAARLAMFGLRYIPDAPHRPVLMTSASEPYEAVRMLLTEIDAKYGLASTDRGFMSVTPEQLAEEGSRSFLADPAAFAVNRTVPIRHDQDDVSLLAPIDVQIPQAVAHVSPDLHWYVDVVMPGRLMPARTAIPSRALLHDPPGSIPDTIARAGRHGISFSSANMGFVPAGVPIEGRLARPLLRFPSAEQVFTELAAARQATAQRSDAGRRAANAVELWGSFDAIVSDLRRPTRALLDAFLPPNKKRDGAYETGYAIRGDGYLTFPHAAAVLSADTDLTRATLDRLLRLNVLRRGLLLSCERFRWQAFYPIEQLGPSFRCAACSHSSPVTQGRWYKGDPEPTWNYSLDQVVRDLLRQHGDLPLLTAAHLRGDARDFLWAPELIIQNETGPVELDICLIINGRVAVGEAKSNGRLDTSGRGTGLAARRLVRVAQLLVTDEIVLATSEPAWAPGALTAVKQALEAGWKIGPVPKINIVVDIGN